jgi:hypothetical protein
MTQLRHGSMKRREQQGQGKGLIEKTFARLRLKGARFKGGTSRNEIPAISRTKASEEKVGLDMPKLQLVAAAAPHSVDSRSRDFRREFERDR